MAVIYYFCFGVEPTKEHPEFWRVQAGWAHVFFRRPEGNYEQEARAMVEAMKWTIQTLQIARATDESHLAALPQDIQQALRQKDDYVEFSAYETGGGSDQAGNPFA